MFNAASYTVLFSALILIWPLWTLSNPVLAAVLLVANTILFALVVYYVSSSYVTYWTGFTDIAGSYMSGCANITLIYIFPLLAVYYFIAVIQTLIGLFKGKEYTEEKWAAMVDGPGSFGRMRQRRTAPRPLKHASERTGERIKPTVARQPGGIPPRGQPNANAAADVARPSPQTTASIKVRCPACGHDFIRPASQAGKLEKCPKCRSVHRLLAGSNQ